MQRVTFSDAYGYFTASVKFPSSGLVRIAWSEPGTGQVHSRTAPVTIS